MKLIDIEKISEIFVSVVVNLKIRSEEYNSGVRLHGRLQEMLTDDAVYIVRAGYTL